MAGYRPPPRNSIEEHLAVAASRVALPAPGWTPKLATRPFVEDLIREKIIGGPKPMARERGRGSARRFQPKDYRDLLRVIKMKSAGVTSRDAWIIDLWLNGREYELSKIKESLKREIKRFLVEALADYTPTGRFKMSPSKRYDRRVRQRPAGLLFPDLIDLVEPAFIGIVEPTRVNDIDVDVGKLSAQIAETVGPYAANGVFSESEISRILQQTVASLKSGVALSPELQQDSFNLAKWMVAPLMGTRPPVSADSFLIGIYRSAEKLGGLFARRSADDRFLSALSRSSEAQLKLARARYNGIRFGRLQAAFEQAAANAHGELETGPEMLTLASNAAARQRSIINANRGFALQLFFEYLLDIVGSTTPTKLRFPDANPILRGWRGHRGQR